MSNEKLIQFKAGLCGVDTETQPYKVKPLATKGLIYLYAEDELIHFCWKPRDADTSEAPEELDLMMVPTDGSFLPYEPDLTEHASGKTNGRIFVLKFTSSSQRYFFWLQSKSKKSDPSYISVKDRQIGDVVNLYLQGAEDDAVEVLRRIMRGDYDNADDNGEDETMEDVEGHGDRNEHHRGSNGGAGPDATGGDYREEGEQSREGGSDGARAASGNPAFAAPTDAQTAVNNFLRSLQGDQNLGQAAPSDQFTTLSDLLTPETTGPVIEKADDTLLNNFLNFLPPTVLLLSQESASQIDGMVEPNAGTTQAAIEAMSAEQKRGVILRVLRSPQFSQSMGSLTMALREGGLVSVAEALRLKVGDKAVYAQGGDAVKQFVEAIHKEVVEEEQK